MPPVFNVSFLERATEPGVVMGSKAVGEPPLMLAFSVREAIRAAVAAFGDGGLVTLDSPATPERVYWAIQAAKASVEPAHSTSPAHKQNSPRNSAAPDVRSPCRNPDTPDAPPAPEPP
jgi:xanthine dehydrogenase large subunit